MMEAIKAKVDVSGEKDVAGNTAQPVDVQVQVL